MDGEWVGEHVTKDIYIETDGRHAFYAGGQTYAGVDGETILEMVTSRCCTGSSMATGGLRLMPVTTARG
jgi:hypothetical protein